MVEVGNIALEIMKQCETISKIVCNASYLKVDCYQFRNDLSEESTANFAIVLMWKMLDISYYTVQP